MGGTALPQVARAAAIAGIGWVVLNRDVEYISELRKAYRVPAFCITSDHEEIGRIQGRQFAAILPNGGAVLYIQGPSESLAAKQRTFGMYETKPAEVQVKLMKAQWTEASAQRTVSSWLRLSTSQQTHLDLIAAQDDSMALGARKAFQEELNLQARERWLKLPYIGCDGLPDSGQTWVRRGLLTATIFVPPNAGTASGDAGAGHSKRHDAGRALDGCASVDSCARCSGGIPRREDARAIGGRRLG